MTAGRLLCVVCLAIMPIAGNVAQGDDVSKAPVAAGKTPDKTATNKGGAQNKPRDTEALRNQLLAFNKMTLAEAYQKVGQHGPWDEDVRVALDGYAEMFTDGTLLGRVALQMYSGANNLLNARMALGRALAAGCEDPLILYMQSMNEGDASRKQALLWQSFEGLKQRRYPAVRQYWCAIRLLQSHIMTADAADNPQCRQALDDIAPLVTRMMAQEKVPDCYLTSLFGSLSPVSLQDLYNGQPELSKALFNNLLKIPPQGNKNLPILQTIRGITYCNIAWIYRGNDWAGNVTEDGWKGFRENLGHAREELTKAWQAAPGLPFAPAQMITIAMGDERGDEKVWFERAIAADPGCMAAYEAYRNSIMPRWGGSVNALLDLGLLCAKSDHFDEGVPIVFFSCLGSALMDSQDEETIWKDARVWEAAKKVCGAMIEHVPDSDKNNVRMCMLSLAWRCHAMDEAAALWKQLGGNLRQQYLHPMVKGNVNVISRDIEQYIAGRH